MKVAIVHDYLTTFGGGERVLELFHDLYHEADIYTLMYSQTRMPSQYASWKIHTSFLNKIPLKGKLFKLLVPWMPLAIESFDFSGYDLVISISAGFAKGIITPVSTCHIAYTLTVPRFLWGYETSWQVHHKNHFYLPLVNSYLRMWDKLAADRVDYFFANSQTVQKRIHKAYGANAAVVYSPVDEKKYVLSTIKREDVFLIVSRLEEYKHIDLAIQACMRIGAKLRIIGEGRMRRGLEKIASGNVEFLGHVSDDVILQHYHSAKAVIFPGADDLGLVPIEAQMCGTPVVAFRKDGALETVIEGISGIFFDELNVVTLADVLRKCEQTNFDPERIRNSVMKFSRSEISSYVKKLIDQCYQDYQHEFIH